MPFHQLLQNCVLDHRILVAPRRQSTRNGPTVAGPRRMAKLRPPPKRRHRAPQEARPLVDKVLVILAAFVFAASIIVMTRVKQRMEAKGRARRWQEREELFSHRRHRSTGRHSGSRVNGPRPAHGAIVALLAESLPDRIEVGGADVVAAYRGDVPVHGGHNPPGGLYGRRGQAPRRWRDGCPASGLVIARSVRRRASAGSGLRSGSHV